MNIAAVQHHKDDADALRALLDGALAGADGLRRDVDFLKLEKDESVRLFHECVEYFQHLHNQGFLFCDELMAKVVGLLSRIDSGSDGTVRLGSSAANLRNELSTLNAQLRETVLLLREFDFHPKIASFLAVIEWDGKPKGEK